MISGGRQSISDHRLIISEGHQLKYVVAAKEFSGGRQLLFTAAAK